jgi:hypothetical protein
MGRALFAPKKTRRYNTRYSRQWRRELIVYDDIKLTLSSRYTLSMSTLLLVSVVFTQTRHHCRLLPVYFGPVLCLCFQSGTCHYSYVLLAFPCYFFCSFPRPSQTWHWSSSPGVNWKPLLCPDYRVTKTHSCNLETWVSAFLLPHSPPHTHSAERHLLHEPSGSGRKHSVSHTSTLFQTQSRLVLQVSANHCS